MLPPPEHSGEHGDDVLLDSSTAGESQRHPGPPQGPDQAPALRGFWASLAMKEERSLKFRSLSKVLSQPGSCDVLLAARASVSPCRKG